MLNEEQFFRQLASHMVAAVRIQVASRTEQICKCWQKRYAGNRRGERRQVADKQRRATSATRGYWHWCCIHQWTVSIM